MPRRRPRCALRNFVRLGCSIAALLLSWLRRRFRRCRLCARFRRLVGADRRRDPARLWFTAGRACLFKRADRGRRPLRDLVALVYPDLDADAADDDSRTRCVDADRDLVGVSLDLDARDAGIRQHPLDRAADAQVLVQLLSIVLVGVPLAVPGIDVAEAKAVGVNFLAHQPPSSTMIVILLRRRRMISARPRARGVMRRNLTPSPTNARVTRRCLGSML